MTELGDSNTVKLQARDPLQASPITDLDLRSVGNALELLRIMLDGDNNSVSAGVGGGKKRKLKSDIVQLSEDQHESSSRKPKNCIKLKGPAHPLELEDRPSTPELDQVKLDLAKAGLEAAELEAKISAAKAVHWCRFCSAVCNHVKQKPGEGASYTYEFYSCRMIEKAPLCPAPTDIELFTLEGEAEAEEEEETWYYGFSRISCWASCREDERVDPLSMSHPVFLVVEVCRFPEWDWERQQCHSSSTIFMFYKSTLPLFYNLDCLFDNPSPHDTSTRRGSENHDCMRGLMKLR